MSRETKTGSSRRKGDVYQDLTALQLALEFYLEGSDFELYIEYEDAGSLDDVFIVFSDRVCGYQVKHAVDEHAVYSKDDFTDPKSRVYIHKFAKSWKKLKDDFPQHKLELNLRSNRGLDTSLGELIDGNGFFVQKFREGRFRKEKGEWRKNIMEATGLTESEFQQFIECFHFDVGKPNWKKLEEHIQAVLLDHKLGVSDCRIFEALKALIERYAIEIVNPITPKIIDSFFSKTQTRFLLPQIFPVEEERFVESHNFKEQLDSQLNLTESGYIVVTGPPGCGKSTALSQYFAELEKKRANEFSVIRYYCFVQIHDNHQGLRLEAQSLHVNLLTELKKNFSKILNKRRFDFSKEHFLEAIEIVAGHCKNNGKKFLIFIDGLDHVERDREIQNSVIDALPNELPPNMLIIIGTQELHNWKPLSLHQGRQENHISVPKFSMNETQEYLEKCCNFSIPQNFIKQIFKKSDGLPLYLKYLSEIISESDDLDATIKSIPALVNGNIRSYYDMLWTTFDAEGKSNAKYLCKVLCCLRFSIHENELFNFQNGILDKPTLENAFRQIRHLLHTKNTLVVIFHNSFRVFILEQLSKETKQEISLAITSNLKKEAYKSSRWFKHVFRYALDAQDYKYILEHINRLFVDTALMKFRNKSEIMNAIDCGIKAAIETNDFVALGRLGSLKYRTNERFEANFSWIKMIEILLYQGHIEQVIDFVYSEDTENLIANEGDTLDVILKLVEADKLELGKKLFEIFLKNFNTEQELTGSEITSLACCLGIFPNQITNVFEWLKKIPIQQGLLGLDSPTFNYLPCLKSYFEGLASIEEIQPSKFFKNAGDLFQKKAVQELIIFVAAKNEQIKVLKSEIKDYIENYPDETNLMLAYLAAKAGISVEDVNSLAGQFKFPPKDITNESFRDELKNQAQNFAYWSVLFGYAQDNQTTNIIKSSLLKSETIWSCTQKHLLKVGQVLGSHYANIEIEWFSFAEDTIKELEEASEVSGESSMDALDVCRSILPKTLGWLSEVLSIRCPNRLNDWCDILRNLRKSFIWTTHYGLGERITNYSFEFPIWKKQSEFPSMKNKLIDIFEDCAKDYKEALSLKGSLRGEHFLAISYLAALCGFKSKSTTWMKCGVEASLAYGFRKDTTLSNLISITEILNKKQPEKTLSRCSAILEMIKWMPEVTDGRMTTGFAQELFPVVLNNNCSVALSLLRKYYSHFANWQANESLTAYILNNKESDPEFLWALATLLDPNESLNVRQHIAQLKESEFGKRLDGYIRSFINPRHWPDDLWIKMSKNHERPERKYRQLETKNDPKPYKLDSELVNHSEVISRCKQSFEELQKNLEKLKERDKKLKEQSQKDKDSASDNGLIEVSSKQSLENEEYISEYDLIDVLPIHIERASTTKELDEIDLFVKELKNYGSKSTFLEKLGAKYIDLGEIKKGLKYIENSMFQVIEFGSSRIMNHLTLLNRFDSDHAKEALIKSIQNYMKPDYSGFLIPKILATACDIFGEIDQTEKIFDDYLEHCQELFAHLPKEYWFEEFQNGMSIEEDENNQFVNLLVDQLSTPELDLGERLIVAFEELIEKHGKFIVPILIERLNSAEGIQLWRLIILLTNLASTNPELFREHCESLISICKCNNIFIRLSVYKSFMLVFSEEIPPEKVTGYIQKVESDYSSKIFYKGFRIMHSKPTKDFTELVSKGALFLFKRQLEAVCEIFDLEIESVQAYLERKFIDDNTTVEHELSKVKSMWTEFSHPQGWPINWFYSDFHVKVSELLYETLDEILRKQRLSKDYLDVLWLVIQACDPKFCAYKLKPLPRDIQPLFIVNKEEWFVGQLFSGSDYEKIIKIEESIPDEWITVFEFSQLSQDNPYHIEYATQIHVSSVLFKPELVEKIKRDNIQEYCEHEVVLHSKENLTWSQFLNALRTKVYKPILNNMIIPFISYREKQIGFIGFHKIANFSSFIIQEFSLSFKDFDVFDGDEKIGYFEAWQEAYSDEKYNKKPISFGTRFRAKNKFIQKICDTLKMSFAIQTVEVRCVMKDYEAEPVEQNNSTYLKIWPFPNISKTEQIK